MNKFSARSESYSKKKLLDDSSYDCSYYNATNHLARDCMLKNMNE